MFLVWHGALVLALRGPKRYNSFPAFSPTCNPANCSWRRRRFPPIWERVAKPVRPLTPAC
ncbi:MULTISPECIES: alpha/beta hydrolase-fold protein [unclassified Sulfitobacter]|uniref:alpha/beta hydrolase-fold protein n=1 Tax=unclassified Sulfitobacter TaxID=196795 RepID=UPI0037457C45